MKPSAPPLDILIVKTGSTEPAVVAQHGDYDDWFRFQLEHHNCRLHLCKAWLGEALPDPTAFHGIILTGSPSSVRDSEPWMSLLGPWAIEAAKQQTPVLAVCFGHQLIGEALGGFVDTNPAGPEYGTIRVQLTHQGLASPLFHQLPPEFAAQSTHRDILITPPAATLLASTDNTKWQAFAWGPYLHAVQFHPEIPPAALQSLCRVRDIPAEIEPRSHGEQILSNWISRCIRGHLPET